MNLKQSIPLKSIRNSRELGGYEVSGGKTVKKGVLLRTASLNGISDEDHRTLTDVYRTEHIIDFRMPMEMKDAEDPAIDGAEYHHVDVIDPAFMAGADPSGFNIKKIDLIEMINLAQQAGMLDENMYVLFLKTQTGRDAYAEFFRILINADPGRAVLWHCTGGKDRTGIAAMLLLSALGADEELVINDYLLTNVYNAQRIEGTKQYLRAKGCDDATIAKAILVFDAVDERFMRNAVGYLKNEYGSVTGFIRDGLNISQAEIEHLKEKYLE